jgi:hypothetical protein
VPIFKGSLFVVENAAAESLIIRSLRRQTCPPIQIKSSAPGTNRRHAPRATAVRCPQPAGGSRRASSSSRCRLPWLSRLRRLPRAKAKKPISRRHNDLTSIQTHSVECYRFEQRINLVVCGSSARSGRRGRCFRRRELDERSRQLVPQTSLSRGPTYRRGGGGKTPRDCVAALRSGRTRFAGGRPTSGGGRSSMSSPPPSCIRNRPARQRRSHRRPD